MGNRPNASDSVTIDEFAKLYDDKEIGIHSPLALTRAVFHIAMIFGTRGRSELRNIRYGDWIIKTENESEYITMDVERFF